MRVNLVSGFDVRWRQSHLVYLSFQRSQVVFLIGKELIKPSVIINLAT